MKPVRIKTGLKEFGTVSVTLDTYNRGMFLDISKDQFLSNGWHSGPEDKNTDDKVVLYSEGEIFHTTIKPSTFNRAVKILKNRG
jgi:hypothetical protein